MASQAPANSGLPMFYQSLTPLQSNVHQDLALVERSNFPFAKGANAIPITIDEFVICQKHYPIVFTPEENGAPLALMGLADGDNLFLDAAGNWKEGTYVPAYVRRYPFMLARLTPEAQDLSLCFDDTSDLVSNDSSAKFFTGTDPSDVTKNVLQFCEQFELAVQRTRAFMTELQTYKVLQDAEANASINGQNMTFRGFKTIDEKLVQELRGDQTRKLVQNGMLGLIYAHFFSLGNMQNLLQIADGAGRLPDQGKLN
jgi:SapC